MNELVLADYAPFSPYQSGMIVLHTTSPYDTSLWPNFHSTLHQLSYFFSFLFPNSHKLRRLFSNTLNAFMPFIVVGLLSVLISLGLYTMPQQTDSDNNAVNVPNNPELLMLPGLDASKGSFTMLDTLGGKSVKLDELGPMVVNTDGVRRFVA